MSLCRGGGLSIYIMNNIDHTKRCDLERNETEVILLELTVSRKKTLVYFIYGPPNEHTVPFNVWLNCMEDAYGTA